MRNTQITLKAQVDYNEKFPPRDAKKAYIAKIVGRVAGPMKFNREFLGDLVTLVEGDEGLYEKQNVDKKGGCTRYYQVVLSHPEHGVMLSVDCENSLAQIAKLLDDGVTIEEAVEATSIRPSTKVEGRMVFDVAVRTKSQAKKSGEAATIDSAIARCWETLAGMHEKDAKKVLAALKAKLNPPTPAPATEQQAAQ